MKLTLKAALALGATAIAGAASAECGIEAGSVRILSNDFEALRYINDTAMECASDAVTVEANATSEHKNIQGPALSIDPAEYTVAVIANNSIVPLLNDDLIRPLDDLIAEYGDQLLPNQVISTGGEAMAIAFMGNGQHLFYRSDILEEAGVEVPTTYEEMLSAAEAIQEAGLMEHPLAASVKPGWDLAAEFVNLYLGTGGEFFEPGSAALAIDNEDGRLVLETMRAMTEYMDPDYLTFDANVINQLWDAGQVAMMNQWGSLAGAAIGDAADPDVAANTAFATTPSIGGNAIPAAALWWDGFSIAKNISDEDAAASFQAMMHGISPEAVAENPTVATWLVDGYQPGEAAVGVIANANAGARAYPMTPYMGLLHTALSTELADFIAGREDADQALADVKAAYDDAASAAGFLQ
ncbi:ABC transporter substrate-binding protein [Pseudoroseicyclus tamaricis]|uniref:Extracellular solute-binding protein n=1 Tax=Pseudoroseicyclus tamaricis TaxID=2705421 RepID=A0A6B2JGG3_9RHOB|nr:extracellular solute-binding protein [Pseudoroseicyclus tamaricis]NDV00281.1 extracellular solute-binding protein [Pseudoroseicyclus tamaricis]